MKIMRIPFSAFILSTLFFISSAAWTQSVVIGSIPSSQFCAGDPIKIGFTATGNFGHKNAFTLQLSDAAGSFQSGFRNIGSLIDSLSGLHSITTTIPSDIVGSAHYRFRMIAAVPYTAGSDNGNDITIGSKPSIGWDRVTPEIPFAGDSVQFNVGTQFHDTIPDVISTSWNFGMDAIPPIAVGSRMQKVVYQKGGDKTVTVTVSTAAGCTSTDSLTVHVLDCMPPIPKNAVVVNDGSMNGNGGSIYWVNPGVTFSGGGSCTIFAEPGSTILNNGSGSNIIYLKTGASYINGGGGGNIIVYADGASIPANFSIAYKCSSLDFDYTNAPPNSAHPLEGVVNTSLPSLTISPNPTRGIITIQGAPLNDLNISVLNILGETVMELKNSHTSNFTLDLSNLVSGTYYIRFSSANSVVTKKIIKN